jgi:hypothetical protein
MGDCHLLRNLGNINLYYNDCRVPKDMEQTFHTLIHVAPKMDVDELMMVR